MVTGPYVGRRGGNGGVGVGVVGGDCMTGTCCLRTGAVGTLGQLSRLLAVAGVFSAVGSGDATLTKGHTARLGPHYCTLLQLS